MAITNAQQARQLDKDRVESVNAMGKQASSVGDELSRIFQIANANDEFNLNQLAKFSDTLNQGLETAAKTVGTVKGGEKVVKAASGKLSIAGADGKATARMVDPSDVRRTKVSQVAGAVKDKFSHLKAFPKL